MPYVVERFELHERAGATELAYHGELGTDLWALGHRCGRLVAATWVETVRGSLDPVRAEAERQAQRR